MKRRTLWKLLASIMAFTMAAAPAITVCAEDVTEPVINEDPDHPVVIDGNVNVIYDESSSVNFAVMADEDAEIIVKDDVNFTSKQDGGGQAIYNAGGNINVFGSVKMTADDPCSGAAVSNTGGTTTIGGDVVLDDQNTDMAFAIYESDSADTATIIVGGDVKSGCEGISVENANVYVDGDVEAAGGGVSLSVFEDRSDCSIIIMGTVSAEYGIGAEGHLLVDGTTEQSFVEQLHNVVVYAIDTPEEENLVGAGAMNLDKDVTTDLFKKAINYIIHTEGDMDLSGDDLKSVSDFATFTDLKEDHRTTKIGEIFTATVAKNYGIEGSSSVEVTKVSDGVYSVKLIDSKGGILLKATALSPNQNQNPGDGTAEDSRNDSSQTAPVLFVIQDDSQNQQATSTISTAVGNVPAGALRVAVPYGTKTIAPAFEGAPSPTNAVSIKVSELTDAQYKEAIIRNISSTPMGGMLRIETDKAACFDRAMLETFAKRASVNLEVIFPVKGQMVRVVVPAGCNINNLLDEFGYCGFERLASILGSEVVK
ncbi:hypothetical protein [Butyrivibrio sp. AE2015]|uniref:hypothetical protein n=1 Tax=Butyrivibrio sp. AE2015 TaxID=1280663 RepID=UPI0003B7AC17|nr:hypothetical protein [Butyrivibrio sp. AE2015]